MTNTNELSLVKDRLQSRYPNMSGEDIADLREYWQGVMGLREQAPLAELGPLEYALAFDPVRKATA